VRERGLEGGLLLRELACFFFEGTCCSSPFLSGKSSCDFCTPSRINICEDGGVGSRAEAAGFELRGRTSTGAGLFDLLLSLWSPSLAAGEGTALGDAVCVRRGKLNE